MEDDGSGDAGMVRMCADAGGLAGVGFDAEPTEPPKRIPIDPEDVADGWQTLDTLYIIASSDGWVKIGRSMDPIRRLASFKSQAAELRIIATAVRCGAYEYAVHAALDTYRGRGEWFDAQCLVELFAHGTIEAYLDHIKAKPSRTKGQKARRPDDMRTLRGAEWHAHRAMLAAKRTA